MSSAVTDDLFRGNISFIDWVFEINENTPGISSTYSLVVPMVSYRWRR